MRWRTVWVLLAALGVGVVVLVVDRRGSSVPPPLLSFPQLAVTQLRVVRGGDTTVVAKVDTSWRVVTPVADLADERAVSAVLEQLAELHTERRFALEGEPAAFGLHPPELEVHVSGAGFPPVALALGAPTPSGRSHYASVDGGRTVALVPGRVKDRLHTSTADLRSRRVLTLDPEEVTSIRREGMGASLSLVREGGRWEMRAPVVARADEVAVRSTLRRLREPVAARFVDSSWPPEATWVFSHDALAETLVVTWIGPDSLLVGSSLRPQALVADSSLASTLLAPTDTWRSHDLLPVSSYEVRRLTLVSAGDTLRLERDGRGRWRVGTALAETPQVMRLLRGLEVSRVRFEAGLSSFSPDLSLVVGDGDGLDSPILFGPPGPSGRVVHAGHLGGFARVMTPALDTLVLSSEAWRSRRIVPLDAYAVERIAVECGGRNATATRRDFDRWKTSRTWQTPCSPDSLVRTLLDARVETFLDTLDPTLLHETATVSLSSHDETVMLVLGRWGSDSLLAAVEGRVVRLDRDLVRAVRGAVERPRG